MGGGEPYDRDRGPQGRSRSAAAAGGALALGLGLSMRLAVYADFGYRRGEGRLWAEMPVVLFIGGLVGHFASVTLIGRLDPRPGRWHHPVPAGVAFAPLPHYPALSRPVGLLRA